MSNVQFRKNNGFFSNTIRHRGRSYWINAAANRWIKLDLKDDLESLRILCAIYSDLKLFNTNTLNN